MKELSSGATATQELINLLHEIVVSFGDADSRPGDKIALYEKCRELQKTHRIKLVGRFIVISGNGNRRRRRKRSSIQARRGKSQLRLAQPAENRESASATSASKA